MTAAEKATELVNQWLDETRGLPMTLQLAKLGLKVAEAIDAVEQASYERGIRDVVEFQDQAPDEQTQALVHIAGLAGAEGIWVVRECKNPALIFNWEGQGHNDYLDIVDARLIFVARFPEGDDGEPGVEFHTGGDEAS